MRLFAWSGQRGAALAQYENCRDILAEELGVEPEAETTKLYEQIIAGEITPRLTYETVAQSSRPLHNLPAQLTSFVGRESALTQLSKQLQMPACRLLTLVGVGGVGKTRLAMQVGQSLLQIVEEGTVFTHGIFFVPLANVDGLSSTAAETSLSNSLALLVGDLLGVSFSGAETPIIELGNYIKEKEMLLILDNFEHLLPTATHFLVTLLQTAPRLKVLATSRERLNVRGEQIFMVPGLAFPSNKPTNKDEPQSWHEYGAIQLFLQTAQTIEPSFTLSAAEETAVSRICQLVEGLPLGVELAATWVRVLSCSDIAQEIERGIEFLETTMHDMPERHRSLRAVFDYSWDLLSSKAQVIFQKLAVFRGGFSREAAIAVAGASLPILQNLVDTSLVRRVTTNHGSGPRYQILEIVRQYGLGKLRQDETIAQETYEQHCFFYLQQLKTIQTWIQGEKQSEALAQIGTDIENVRAAWNWGVRHQHYIQIEQALQSLFHFYDMRSWFQEGEDVFATAAATIPSDVPLIQGKVMARQGWFTFHLGRQIEAKALLEKSIEALRPLSQPSALIFPLNYLGAVNHYLGAYETARQLCYESLSLSENIGNRYSQAIAYNILGLIDHRLHDLEAAQEFCRRSLTLAKEIGNRWSMSFSLDNLGNISFALAHYEEADNLFRESLAIRETMRDRRGVAICLNALGETAMAMGELTAAQAKYQESLALFREIGNQQGMITSFIGLGDVARQQGAYEEAKAFYDSALRRAMAIDAFPRVLDILQTLITLWQATKQPEQVATIKSFIRHAPVINEVPRTLLAEFVEQVLKTAVE